jgi:hypothetical protein
MEELARNGPSSWRAGAYIRAVASVAAGREPNLFQADHDRDLAESGYLPGGRMKLIRLWFLAGLLAAFIV